MRKYSVICFGIYWGKVNSKQEAKEMRAEIKQIFQNEHILSSLLI